MGAHLDEGRDTPIPKALLTVTVRVSYYGRVDDEGGGFSIDQLAERVGTPVRTIRYYIAEGLLPGPGARGKAATYGDEHLARLRLIRRLVEQRVPLAEIRERLARLSAAEVAALLAGEDRHAADLLRVAELPSPKEYIAALLRQGQHGRPTTPAMPPAPARVPMASPAMGQSPGRAPAPRQEPREPYRIDVGAAEPWLRLELAPGVELHVSAEAKERHHALVERILGAARELRD